MEEEKGSLQHRRKAERRSATASTSHTEGLREEGTLTTRDREDEVRAEPKTQ